MICRSRINRAVGDAARAATHDETLADMCRRTVPTDTFCLLGVLRYSD